MSSNAGKITILLTALIIVGVLATLLLALKDSSTTGTASTNSATQNATTVSSTTSAPTTLDIAAENAADPWSKADGTGCANDIVRAAYQAVGVRVNYDVMPYARAKQRVMSGESVACIAMSWSKELEGKVRFADADKPIYQCTPAFVQNLAAPVKGKIPKELGSGNTIGIVIDYEYSSDLWDLEKQGVKFERNSSEVLNLKKLALGRLDLAVVNIDMFKTANRLFHEADVEGKVAVVYAGASLDSHIGFSTAHPQGEFARTQFNKGFATIQSNGTLEKIRDAWRGK